MSKLDTISNKLGLEREPIPCNRCGKRLYNIEKIWIVGGKELLCEGCKNRWIKEKEARI